MEATLYYFALPWAVVGIADQGAAFSLTSLRRGDERLEQAVDRYVRGYLRMWGIGLPRDAFNPVSPDGEVVRQAQERIAVYASQHPPVQRLPKFYLVLLNQLQTGSDAYGFGDVFCL